MADLVLGGLNVIQDDQGRLHFWGEVFNLGDKAQRWVRVNVRLLRGDDSVAAEETDILGLEWTLPGARNPFHIRFLEPPSRWSRYALIINGTEHDLEDQDLPQPYPALEADRIHFRQVGWGGLVCTLIALLSNRGLGQATHVKAAGTLYGPDGKVVGAQSPYLVPRGVFEPGAQLPFELKFYALGGDVESYTLQVQGRVRQF
jgi:hypothetical protein